MTAITLEPVGVIHSPWKEKFAVPRQPGLVEEGTGELHFHAPYNSPEAVRGLEDFSHLWILFLFHHTMDKGWHPTVRPPRLGGNSRVGVFATRSTFRPNPVGLSLVALRGIRIEKKNVILQLGSLDLIDGTPVLDIKPYLPFAESIPDARAGFAQYAPDAEMPVTFSPAAQRQLRDYQAQYPLLERFICQVLAQDPRPAYRKKEQTEREYAALLAGFNVRWRVDLTGTIVIAIDPT
ncbi:MAG: tRNA (adenine(37)-N6)-methyltransferase [Candidatus Erwinia impunctatus]